MAIKKFKIEPDYVAKPGDTIRDSLEAINMTQSELAEKMGITRKHVSELITGKTRILPQTATQLAYVFNVVPTFWLSLQVQYDAFNEHQKQARSLKENENYSKNFPYTQMAQNGFVPKTNVLSERLDNLLKFFRVPSVETLKMVMAQDPLLQGAFRFNSQQIEVDSYALHAWLQQGLLLATNIQTKAFDMKQLQKEISQMRTLTLMSDPTIFLPKLQAIAASVGIAVVIVPELPKSRVSGATRWQSPYPKAIIELSLRDQTHDSFWMTFFHELGHIVLHRKTAFFTINKHYGQGREEREADLWASSILIPDRAWQSFVNEGDFSVEKITDFAGLIQTHPDIVLGRLQNEGFVSDNQMSELHERY